MKEKEEEKSELVYIFFFLYSRWFFFRSQHHFLFIGGSYIWCHVDRAQRRHFGAVPGVGSDWHRDSRLARHHTVPRDVLSNDARFDFQLFRVRFDAAWRTALGCFTRHGDWIMRHVLRFVFKSNVLLMKIPGRN